MEINRQRWAFRRHWVGAGHGTLHSVNGHSGGFALGHTDLGNSDAVAAGDGKDGAVALVFDDGEKAPHFLLGVEGDGAVLSACCGSW